VFVQSTQTAAWSQEGEDIFPVANGVPWSEIPFRLVSADGNQFLPARPPMHDLAELNRDHLNNSAALERSLFYCGSPMWFIAGMTAPEGGLRIGSSSALFCGDPQAKASVVQSGAESIGAIASQMTEKREQMAIIGARFLSQEASQVAVETAQIHRAGDTASLSTISGAIEDGLTASLKWCALFMGTDPDLCKVTLSRDYMPRRMNFQELTALVASWQSGAMPTADLYDNLVKGEIVTARQGGAEEFEEELQTAPVDVGVV
jgi:hypothetical protein